VATRLFSDLVNRVAPNAPGCPQPVLITFIRTAAIDACERTLAWRFEQPAVRLTPAVENYPYEPVSGAEVHAIITASINGVNAPSITLESAHRLYPKYPDNSTAELGTPKYIVHVDPDTFWVARLPNSSPTYDVVMFLALKPLPSATGMDTSVMDELETVIFHGALQNLLTMPERTWSDKELAAYHAKQFAFRISERRARVNVGAGRAVLTAYAPPLA